MNMPFQSNNKGMTVIELMVVVGIAGILAAIAIPAMDTLIQTNRISAQAREIVTAFNYARSEAVTRKQDVSVVPTDGADWNNGLTIWLDDDGDNTVDNNAEEVLQVFDGLSGSTLTPSAAIVRTTFDSDGFLSTPSASPDFTLQLDNCKVDGRTITLNLNGRVEISTAACP